MSGCIGAGGCFLEITSLSILYLIFLALLRIASPPRTLNEVDLK